MNEKKKRAPKSQPAKQAAAADLKKRARQAKKPSNPFLVKHPPKRLGR